MFEESLRNLTITWLSSRIATVTRASSPRRVVPPPYVVIGTFPSSPAAHRPLLGGHLDRARFADRLAHGRLHHVVRCTPLAHQQEGIHVAVDRGKRRPVDHRSSWDSLLTYFVPVVILAPLRWAFRWFLTW